VLVTGDGPRRSALPADGIVAVETARNGCKKTSRAAMVGVRIDRAGRTGRTARLARQLGPGAPTVGAGRRVDDHQRVTDPVGRRLPGVAVGGSRESAHRRCPSTSNFSLELSRLSLKHGRRTFRAGGRRRDSKAGLVTDHQHERAGRQPFALGNVKSTPPGNLHAAQRQRAGRRIFQFRDIRTALSAVRTARRADWPGWYMISVIRSGGGVSRMNVASVSALQVLPLNALACRCVACCRARIDAFAAADQFAARAEKSLPAAPVVESLNRQHIVPPAGACRRSSTESISSGDQPLILGVGRPWRFEFQGHVGRRVAAGDFLGR